MKGLIKTFHGDDDSSWHLAGCLKLYRNNAEETSFVPCESHKLPNSGALVTFPKAVQWSQQSDVFVSQLFNEV